MKNGNFPMDKDAGVEACMAYREALEAKGYKTTLKHLWLGVYKVIAYRTIEELNAQLA